MFSVIHVSVGCGAMVAVIVIRCGKLNAFNPLATVKNHPLPSAAALGQLCPARVAQRGRSVDSLVRPKPQTAGLAGLAPILQTDGLGGPRSEVWATRPQTARDPRRIPAVPRRTPRLNSLSVNLVASEVSRLNLIRAKAAGAATVQGFNAPPANLSGCESHAEVASWPDSTRSRLTQQEEKL
jgi:hypothetical protein